MLDLRARVLAGRLSVVVFLSVALAVGCGGGGSSSSQNAGTGPAALGVSVAPAAAFPADTQFSTSPAAVVDPELRRAHDYPTLAHVWVTVVKIALMPVDGDRPCADGEETFEDADHDPDRDADSHSGRVILVPPPGTKFDLLNPPDARQLAKFFNKFDSVPAGTYGKIRVYYSDVTAKLTSGKIVPFHPTAHYHFDVHFVHGPLVIPATTETDAPDGWIRFFKIRISIVGLKIKVVGGSDWDRDDWDCRDNQGRLKVILRPQVFAEFIPPILYSIAGTASDVGPGTLDVTFSERTFHVLYNADTSWSFDDNILGGGRSVDVLPGQGVAALRDGALVEAVGRFQSGSGDFLATDLEIDFPDRLIGDVFHGWTADNTFVLRLPTDNVVFPEPDRFSAVYDNALFPYERLDQSFIADNVAVTARGYTRFVGGVPVGVEAYWISIGP